MKNLQELTLFYPPIIERTFIKFSVLAKKED